MSQNTSENVLNEHVIEPTPVTTNYQLGQSQEAQQPESISSNLDSADLNSDQINPISDDSESDLITNEVQTIPPQVQLEVIKDLNATPLVNVDQFDNFNSYVDKASWNYQEISKRNTLMTTADLAVWTHLYLSDEHQDIYQLETIESAINDFIATINQAINQAKSIKIHDNLVLDGYRFKDHKDPVPIARFVNPQLPIAAESWNNLVPNENQPIIKAYLLILENLLTNGHECSFFTNTILVKNNQSQYSIYFPNTFKKLTPSSDHGTDKKQKKSHK